MGYAVEKPEIFVQLGHSSTVSSVAFSPDGRYALSGGWYLKLWNTSTGTEMKTLFTAQKGSEGIRHVTFTPDGRYAFAGDSEGFIRLWDIETGREIKAFREPLQSFSPDGKYAYTWSDDTLRQWQTSAGRAKATKENIGEICTVAISSDGRRALLGGGKWKAALWLLDMKTGRRIRDFTGHTSRVSSVAMSPDMKYALSGSFDDTVKLWDMATGRQIKSFEGHAREAFQTGDVESVAFSPDGRHALSGSYDETVRLWDVVTGGEIRTFRGHTGGVRTVTFTPDGRHVLSGGSDGTIRLWDLSDDNDIATMTGFVDGEWASVTSEGFFVASKKGAQNINVTIGLTSYTIDNYFETFYNPEIVAKVMAGEPVAALADIKNVTSRPPEVRIISPAPGETFTRKDITITVEATDRGNGVDEVRLYQNHKLVSEEQRGIAITPKKGRSIVKHYQVLLIPGANEFRAIAFNRDRIESNPAIIQIHSEAVHAHADLYILAVGISDYKNPGYKLNYGRADAEAFVNTVEQRGKGIFKHIYKQTIFDSQASRGPIQAAFNHIQARARPEDGFLFYYAGHGVMSEGNEATSADFYIVPYDVTRLYGHDELLKAQAISANELKDLCTGIKAQKQLIILDACQSGGALESFALRGAAEEKAILQLARSAGVVVMAATGTEQFATEFNTLGHGVFTYALLKGLEGEADAGSSPDRKITVKELEAYINDRVPELTEKYRGTAQYPSSFSRGQDFPVSIAN